MDNTDTQNNPQQNWPVNEPVTPTYGSDPGLLEPAMPEPPKKKRLLPIIGTVAAILLVVGVASASYFVSNRLRSQTALAPTAPVSEPQASEPCGSGLYCDKITPPTGSFKCISAVGYETNCCPLGQVIYQNACVQASDFCDVQMRDNPLVRYNGNRRSYLTFQRAGTIKAFSNNIDVDGGLTITIRRGEEIIWDYTTPAPAEPEPPYAPYAIPETFNVNANDVLNVTVDVGGTAYGWRTRKTDTSCGPTNIVCGMDKDISALKAMAEAAGVDLTGIEAGSTQINANYQCWGDALVNDYTQDYDFNDFALVFGYEPTTSRPNYCENASATKTTVLQGETTTLTANSNTPVNTFYFSAYNLDNQKPNTLPGVNDPQAICVGQGPITELCPKGGHQLVFSSAGNLRTHAEVTIGYAQLFDVADVTWGGKKVLRAQFNAYFQKDGEQISLPMPECIFSVVTRPDYCESETINKSVVLPGESVRVSSVSNTNVNGFHYYAYNMDNMRGTNDPWPVCVGNDNPGNPISACPNGGHHLTFTASDTTTLRKNGFVDLNYSKLFDVTDINSGSKPSNIRFSAYFSRNGIDWSLPQPACQKNVSAGTPTETPTEAPMCVKSAIFKQAPNGGAWNEVPAANYDTLKIGDVIRFGVNGNSASFTKGKFRVNGGAWIESSTKMTVGGKSYFYINHTLVSGNYEVLSEIL